MNDRKTILITGCSSGIGAALAREFAGRGHAVIATARRIEALEPLRAAGMRCLALDVTSEASIAALRQQLEADGTALDLLVNNAGYGLFGATTDQSLADMRAQFDTNVFAPVLLTHALLPLLRRRPGGCVAHVGSISGLVTTPFSGLYCASKAAVHSIADAMRMELAPLGIRVVTVQPGGIASQFGANGEQHIHLPPGSPFEPVAQFVQRRAKLSQHGATPAEDFVRIVATHLLDPKAGPICRAGAKSTTLPLMKKLLSTETLDRKMRRAFGLLEKF